MLAMAWPCCLVVLSPAKPKRPLWVLTQTCKQVQRTWTSALALLSPDKIPPPGLEPGSLGREPSILTSSTTVDSEEVVGQGAGLPGGGWLEFLLVSHPPSAEHGLVATYSHGEHDLQCLPDRKHGGEWNISSSNCSNGHLPIASCWHCPTSLCPSVHPIDPLPHPHSPHPHLRWP
jgi:hypothetical protein